MTLPKTVDIVVIGGGIIGTSVAYHIARWGAEVILIERNQFFGEESTAKAAGADGLYVVAGFSGHGFMHGPAAALIAAEEIVDGKATSLDPTPFRPDRFARGAAIQEDIVI
jgi:sarcosine oxidase subunit beta